MNRPHIGFLALAVANCRYTQIRIVNGHQSVTIANPDRNLFRMRRLMAMKNPVIRTGSQRWSAMDKGHAFLNVTTLSVEEYLKKAADMERRANESNSEASRKAFLGLAETWRLLAEGHKKVEQIGRPKVSQDSPVDSSPVDN